MAGPREPATARDIVAEELPAMLRHHVEPLPSPDEPEAFGALFDRFAACRVVLLGEATHGTAEFYRARAGITRRLVARHGFTILAVEADWPDAARIDFRTRPCARTPHRPGLSAPGSKRSGFTPSPA